MTEEFPVVVFVAAAEVSGRRMDRIRAAIDAHPGDATFWCVLTGPSYPRGYWVRSRITVTPGPALDAALSDALMEVTQ